ncbi:hypothetical protein [Kribbia dieselivorans]|uniref:hypothetical protein n=1 Tax=Kribbia dieselivorans TaxID=331526 RepID=UPI000837CEDC|nr:hypothetical protein [Kribbia dieselivorans]
MTPFMTRVAELVGTHPDAVPPAAGAGTTMPQTRLSTRVDTGTGADRHVALRSLTEQYVCEANAVLGSDHTHLDLVDEPLPDELAFSVTFGDHAVRCSTRFVDGRAYGRLVGDVVEDDEPRELESADAVPDLLVRLLEAEIAPPSMPASA